MLRSVCLGVVCLGVWLGCSLDAEASSYEECTYEVDVVKLEKRLSKESPKSVVGLDAVLRVGRVFETSGELGGCEKVGAVLEMPIGNWSEALRDGVRVGSRIVYSHEWLDVEGSLRVISMYRGFAKEPAKKAHP